MIKTAAMTLLAAAAQAEFSIGWIEPLQPVCEIYCADIYSVDPDTCECVPFEWMECHPQYNEECNQYDKDEEMGRDPEQNPYQNEQWYKDSLQPVCEIACAAIYSVDPDTCECVPIEWMECHPQYNEECNQYDTDEEMGRDPEENPYKTEQWY